MTSVPLARAPCERAHVKHEPHGSTGVFLELVPSNPPLANQCIRASEQLGHISRRDETAPCPADRLKKAPTAAWRIHVKCSLAGAEPTRGAAASAEIGKHLTQLQATCQLEEPHSNLECLCSINSSSLSSSRQHTPACLSGRPHTRFRQRLCTSEGLHMTRRSTLEATPQR